MIKKRYTKMLAIILTSVLLVFNCASIGSYAADNDIVSGKNNNVRWEINKTTGLMTVEGKGYIGEWCYIDGVFYTEYKSYVKELVVGDGITGIGCVAFDSCENLTKVTLPNSVSEIVSEAFWGCTSLTKVVFGSGIKKIGQAAFYGTALTEVNIPGNLTSIEDAFTNITTLRKVTIGADNLETFAAFSGCNNLSEITINGTVSSIGAQTFEDCTRLKSLKINGEDITVGDSAFYNCKNLEELSGYEYMTAVGNNAFYGCTKLKSVNLSYQVTRIGDSAFNGCTGLTDVYYSGTKSEWNAIFLGENNSVLNNVTIHYLHTHTYTENIIKIPGLEDGLAEHICECGVKRYEVLPATGEDIRYGICGKNIAWALNMRTGEFKAEGTGDMYSWNDYTEVPWLEYTSNIKSISISDGITSIGGYAFCHCSSLTEIILPDSIKTIEEFAFAFCSNLVSADLGDCVNEIGNYAFYRCEKLKNADLGKELKQLSYGAFYDCSSLTKVDLSDSYELFNPAIFYNCTSLAQISIPDSVTELTSGMFQNCTSLKTVFIPRNIDTIGYSAFYNCTALTDVYFCGTEEEWNAIAIDSHNTYLTNATVHFNHTHSYTASGTEPTAGSDGEMTFTCVCGDFYIEIIPAVGFTPKGSMAVDYGNKIIYGLPTGTRSLDAYTSFTDSSYMWAYANIDAGFGTGTVAILLDETNIIGKYTILIYGDVDGNGWYDANDAFIVNMIASGLISKESLTAAQLAAADCNHDGEINEHDFKLLIDASLLKNVIDQLPENVELESNSVFIEYASLIDQSAGLEVVTPEIEHEEEQSSDQSATELVQDTAIEVILINVFEFIKQIFDFLLSVLVK